MKLEATHVRGLVWAVRPEGRLGTMGWINGKPWTVVYVTSKTAEDAICKAEALGGCDASR